MDQIPNIVVVSGSSTKPKSLIKYITKETNFDEGSENIISHPWTIDTKYYTAQVNIIGLDDKYNLENLRNVEALLIHIDTNKETGLKDINKWVKLDEIHNPEIKLLISNYCTKDTKITKSMATEWCLKNGFEFLELYPSNKKSNSEDEDIIEEKFGVDRIIEALQTHVWPNLVMKEKKRKGKNELCSNGEGVSDGLLSGEGLDDFAELFSQLNMMKGSFQSLPTSQRKQCAEQMVTAFWKAIGGEEEEILDL